MHNPRIGPRKLAKVLSLTFNRWITLQAQSSEPRAASPMRVDASPAQSTQTLCIRPAAQSHGSDQMLSIPAPWPLPERLLASPFSTPAEQLNPFELLETKYDGPDFLLVDDNIINLRMLKRLNHSFGTAMNGQEAVDRFQEHAGNFKCVFMDISMPVMDGFQATRHIRAIEKDRLLQPCIIIALTGLASEASQQEAFASGIDLFLTKPVRLMELTQILAARGLTN